MALGTQTVFELANLMMAEPFYAVDTYALDGSARLDGLTLQAVRSPRAAADTWLVAGTLQPLAAPARRVAAAAGSPRAPGASPACARRLRAGRRRPARRTPRHHALVLGRRLAATPPPGAGRGRPHLHRRRAGLDIRRHDRRDRPALALVEKDLGTRWRARWRTASSCTSAVRAANHNIRKCSGWRPSPTASSWRWNMRGATRQPLSVEELAQAAKLSPPVQPRLHGRDRPVARQGRRRLRLEAARLMIEGSRHPLEVVARETGFRDRRHMREAFLRGFGMPPQAVRRGADDALTRHPVRHGRRPIPLETGRIQAARAVVHHPRRAPAARRMTAASGRPTLELPTRWRASGPASRP